MKLIKALILLLTVLVSIDARAQRHISDARMPESSIDTLTSATIRRSSSLYDTLAARAKTKGFYRMLHSMFIKNIDQSTPLDESLAFRPYQGYTIGEIEIECRNVFDQPGTMLRKAANATHTVTRTWVVKGNLLFAEGDKVDPDLIVRNLQYLRGLNYIYDARIMLIPNQHLEHTVDVVVVTRDSWSFDGDGSVGRADGQLQLSGTLINNNAFGMGSRMKLTQAVYGSRKWYAGTLFEMTVPNLFGSFLQLDLAAGRRFNNRRYLAQLSHEIIRSTDYIAGARIFHNSYPELLLMSDSITNISKRELDFWAGGAVRIPRINSSLYVMGRMYDLRFFDREPVAPAFNPKFHNTRDYLVSAGLFREKFYTGTLIYGYGFKEHISTGYKAEVVGGYTRNEFKDLMYGSVSLTAGRLTSIGHFSGYVGLGCYLATDNNEAVRGVLSAKLNYFTNLIGSGSSRVRQFVSANYMHGINRSTGAGELLKFTKNSGPRSFYELGENGALTGTNRMVVCTETVFFTPWEPAGFRIALFGFVDVGLIGFSNNVFRNDACATIGAGIRLRNERLAFKTIQLKLGIALSKEGLLKNEWLTLTTWNRMQAERYTPVKPAFVEYN